MNDYNIRYTAKVITRIGHICRRLTLYIKWNRIHTNKHQTKE